MLSIESSVLAQKVCFPLWKSLQKLGALSELIRPEREAGKWNTAARYE
jgi:hypothetical protein